MMGQSAAQQNGTARPVAWPFLACAAIRIDSKPESPGQRRRSARGGLRPDSAGRGGAGRVPVQGHLRPARADAGAALTKYAETVGPVPVRCLRQEDKNKKR